MNQTLTQTQTKTKIGIKLIEIDRGEGPAALCGERRFLTWKEADAYLMGVCVEKRINGGYDKCKFKVHYEDGEIYSGRYDAANPGGESYEGPLGTGHIRNHLEFCAGLAKPKWMTDQQYAETLERYKKDFPKLMDESITWLTKYAMDDESPTPATTPAKEIPMNTAATTAPATTKTSKEVRAEHLARRDLENLPPVKITGNTFPVRRVLWTLGGNWMEDAQAWMLPDHTAAEGQRITDEVNHKGAKVSTVKSTVVIPVSPTAPATVKTVVKTAQKVVMVITPAQVKAAAPKVASTALSKRVDCLLAGAKALQAAAEKEGNATLSATIHAAMIEIAKVANA